MRGHAGAGGPKKGTHVTNKLLRGRIVMVKVRGMGLSHCVVKTLTVYSLIHKSAASHQ